MNFKIPSEKEILEKIHFEKIGNTFYATVTEDIYFEAFGLDFFIPMGLKSDGASIPKIFF